MQTLGSMSPARQSDTQPCPLAVTLDGGSREQHSLSVFD
jgi:hypothetical protein